MINVSPKLSNFDYLRIAESRLTSVRMYQPGTYEIERLEMVVADLQSKMTEDELKEYHIKKNAVLTAAEIESNRIAMLKAMAENVDKPSI